MLKRSLKIILILGLSISTVSVKACDSLASEGISSFSVQHLIETDVLESSAIHSLGQVPTHVTSSVKEHLSYAFGVKEPAFLKPHVPAKSPRLFSFQGEIKTASNQACLAYGDRWDGTIRCDQTQSDGKVTKTWIDYTFQGTIFKRQTIIENFDASGQELDRTSIRYRVDHRHDRGVLQKTIERFDIVKRPIEGKITREFIVLEYHPGTEIVKEISWTKYHQIDDQLFAELSDFVDLQYDKNENLITSRSEKLDGSAPIRLSPLTQSAQALENQLKSMLRAAIYA